MTGGNIAGAPACEDTLQRKARQIIRFPHLYINCFFNYSILRWILHLRLSVLTLSKKIKPNRT